MALTVTHEMKKKIVEYWFEMRSTVKVRRSLAKEYDLPMRKVPGGSTIRYVVDKFVREGTVACVWKGRSGRKRDTRLAQNIALVRESVGTDPVFQLGVARKSCV